MIQQGRGGSIVFVASISAFRVNWPQPQAAYSKAYFHTNLLFSSMEGRSRGAILKAGMNSIPEFFRSLAFISPASSSKPRKFHTNWIIDVSKSALLTLKNCLAAEWAKFGIRSNSISPGYMDTILNEGEGIAEGRKIWAERNPLGRMGTPDELTSAVVLLSSVQATYINGKAPQPNRTLNQFSYKISSPTAAEFLTIDRLRD
jgi:NAD(P)-dependent dehydrogenase (short-subunit alcohol dehydrogenase family)